MHRYGSHNFQTKKSVYSSKKITNLSVLRQFKTMVILSTFPMDINELSRNLYNYDIGRIVRIRSASLVRHGSH